MKIGFSGRMKKGDFSQSITDIFEFSIQHGLLFYDLTLDLIHMRLNRPHSAKMLEAAGTYPKMLDKIRKMASDKDMTLSIQAPDSILLTTPNEEIARDSTERCLTLLHLVEEIEADFLILHPGYMHGDQAISKERLIQRLSRICANLKGNAKIGLLIDYFGIADPDNVLDVCSKTDKAVPVYEFGRLKEINGRPLSRELISEVLNRCSSFYPKDWEILVKFSNQLKRKLFSIKEDPTTYKALAASIRQFEESHYQRICLFVDSPEKEMDALLFRNYYIYGDENASYDAFERNRFVRIGSSVKLKDLKHDREMELVIVDPERANPAQRMVSSNSPIAKGLLGKEIGSIVEVTAPGGLFHYQVLNIEAREP